MSFLDRFGSAQVAIRGRFPWGYEDLVVERVLTAETKALIASVGLGVLVYAALHQNGATTEKKVGGGLLAAALAGVVTYQLSEPKGIQRGDRVNLNVDMRGM